MSERAVCEDHRNNHLVGGCMTCTLNECRRYMYLYEDALTLLREQREAKTAAAASDANIDMFLYGADHGLHDVLVEAES